MKSIIEFLKTTLIGGLVVVLPVWISVLLLLKTLGMLSLFFKPIIHELPEHARHPRLLSLLVLILGCFLIGLILRTSIGRLAGRTVERNLLRRIPAYSVFRGFAGQLTGRDASSRFDPCLVELEDALVPAFIVEPHPDGRFTVFVPAAPTPAAGSIYIMAAERVHPVDVTLLKAMGCISKWGSGSGELLAAMKPASAGAAPSAAN